LPFPSPMHESEKVKEKSLSRVRLLATPWNIFDFWNFIYILPFPILNLSSLFTLRIYYLLNANLWRKRIF